MGCFFDHNWSWPRRRGHKDVQVCLKCGGERESKVHFDGPRYRKTQEAIPDSSRLALRVEPDRRRRMVAGISAAA